MTDSIDSLRLYSDRLSPIFVRDIRQGLRGPYFVFAFLALQIGALAGALFEVVLLSFLGEGPTQPLLSGFLGTLLWIGFGLILPFSLFGALQNEVGRGRNIELLLTSSLTRWQVVFGKFCVASSLSALLLISILPYFLLRYFIGNVELTEIAILFGSTLTLNATMNALVIGASSFRGIIARLIALGFFGVIFSATTAISLARSGIFGSTLRNSFADGLAALAVQFCLIAIGLQLGRARIKLFENPIDAPNALVVFLLAIILPVSVGIATATGGSIAVFIVASLFGFLALMIDRGPGPSIFSRNDPTKRSLKGLQP